MEDLRKIIHKILEFVDKIVTNYDLEYTRNEEGINREDSLTLMIYF